MAERQELQVVLRTVAEGQGAQQTASALRQVRQESAATTNQTQSLLRSIAAASLGYLSLQTAIQATSTVFSASINAQRENERTVRATAAAYGQQAKEFERFAAGLSASTNFTSRAILQSALYARTLSANYALSTEQTKNLISVSTDLARVQGLDLFDAFKRASDAVRGEAESAEYLGLTLNDTYMQNQALNGSFQKTWQTMSDGEKAQARYNELLKQTSQFAGFASKDVDSLDAAFGRAENSGNKLALTLGNILKGPATGALNFLSDFANDIAKTLEFSTPDDVRFRAFLGEVFKGGTSLVGAMDAAEAAKTAYVARQAQDRQFEIEQADLEISGQFRRGARQPGAGDPNLALIAALDQRKAAVRDLLQLQGEERAIQTEITRLRTDEAQLLLQTLPARQQIAQLEREIADQVNRRVQLQIESQQIAAEQRAAPVRAALEDTERAIERNRLVLGIRGTSAEERSAARREIRELTRNVAPRQRLAAFDVETPVIGANRRQQAFDLATRASQIPLEQQLVGLRAQARPGEDALLAVQQSIERQENLANIAAARTDQQQQVLGQIIQQAILDGFIKRPPTQIQIQVMAPDGTVSYTELIEAADQAEMPPVVKVSGVRR